jgi:hypothetical protein
MPSSLPSRTPIANDAVGSLVGEFLEERRKEHEQEKARENPRKRNPFLMWVLIVVCGVVWIAPSLIRPRDQELSQESLEQGAKLTLYLASMRVKAYLDTHKRLPASLPEAGVDSAGIEYLRSSPSTFELLTQVRGTRLVYRSKLPDSLFLGPNLRIRGIS